jgi:hypothetical protein
MYRAGVDALTIQFHSRWASDAFKLYKLVQRVCLRRRPEPQQR